LGRLSWDNPIKWGQLHARMASRAVTYLNRCFETGDLDSIERWTEVMVRHTRMLHEFMEFHKDVILKRGVVDRKATREWQVTH